MSELFELQNSYAVLIGTSEYTTLAQLPAVENNLSRLRELFLDDYFCGIPAANCAVVHNPRSNSEMLDPVRDAAAKATDALIVYFAGHGQIHSTGNDFYLTLVGSDGLSMYKSTAYNYLRDELKQSRAKRRIVILDCCYSGRAFGEMGYADESTISLVNNAAAVGTFLIASTAENKPSLALSGEKYTVFTGELINLIQGGIPGEPTILTVGTLFEHVRTALLEKRMPIPQRRDGGLSEEIPLFRNRASHEPPGGARYGAIPGIDEDALFESRRDLHNAKIHRPLQAGICGTAERGGAESIVVSGGYRDDKDYGTFIFYTGHGGRDPNTGVQIRDQSLEDSGNAALLESIMTGLPVRVVRGAGGDPQFSPSAGYSYDGLFLVTDYWTRPSADGPIILQFRLEKISNTGRRPGKSYTYQPGGRRSMRTAIGRYADTKSAIEIKRLYGYMCQVCDITLDVAGGLRIASIVYIRKLELPHGGPDVKANMLCLCPNHCDLFSYGAIIIDDDYKIIDQNGETIGDLTVKHKIDLAYIRYHREHHRIGAQQRQ
ncbi:caspase, EACC1-associated type [Planotetraspora sp. GP83]|uniref:caspase, EACC1-associated type n=1 Tax=Planotetraspora sp. GP83 TaxID=3156264 RepID=UPI0035144FFD